MKKTILLIACLLPLLAFAQKPELIIPDGHAGFVLAAAFSPDGKYLLSGSLDGMAILWEVASGKMIHTFKVSDGINAVSFSGDDRYIFSATNAGIYQWNTYNGELIRTFESLSRSEVSSIDVSPNGQYLLSGHSAMATKNGYATLWDIASGKSVRRFTTDPSYVSGVEFSPDGQWVATAAYQRLPPTDSTIVSIWDAHTGQLLSTLTNPGDFDPLIVFSRDSKSIFIGNQYMNNANQDGIEYQEKDPLPVVHWDFLNGKKTNYFGWHKFSSKAMALSADGRLLYSKGDDNLVIWDIQSRKKVKDLALASFSIGLSDLILSPDGQLLNLDFNGLQIIDLDSGSLLPAFNGIVNKVVSAHFLPDADLLWTIQKKIADPAKTVRWDLQSNHITPFVKQSRDKLVLASSKEKFITGFIRSTFKQDDIRSRMANMQSIDPEYTLKQLLLKSQITIRDIGNQVIRHDLDLPGTIKDLDISTNEQFALINTEDKIRIIDIASGAVIDSLTADETYTAVFNLLGSDSLSTEEKLEKYVPYSSGSATRTRFSQAKFLPNSTAALITTSTIDDSMGRPLFYYHLFHWDVLNHTVDTLISKQSGSILDLAFSPDKRHVSIATYGYGMTPSSLQLWNAHTLQAIDQFPLEEKNDNIYQNQLAFSPDSKYLLTAIWNAAVLYDVKTRKKIRSFAGHRGQIHSLSYLPGGKKFLTSSEDNTSKIWDTSQEEALATLILVDTADWIVTTPSGLFDASPGAMQEMHFVVNYSDNWEIIDLEQLKARYYEPGLLQKLLGFSNERIRPVVDFDQVELYPKVEAHLRGDSLYVNLQERNGGIGKVSIYINGKEIVEEANPESRTGKRDHQIVYDLSQHNNYFFKHPDSTNTVSLRAYNQADWLRSRSIDLEYQYSANSTKGRLNPDEQAEWEGKLFPKMYAITIGTSNYSGDALDLQFADQDATMMARAIQSSGSALFADGDSLEVYCFSTLQEDSTGLEGTPIHWQYADKKNIQATFEAIKKKAKAEDIIAVYLSGHGITFGGMDETQFYYLTHSVSSEEMIKGRDDQPRRDYAISTDELTQWLNDIPALKQVVIVDACSSGAVVEKLSNAPKALNSSQIRAMDRMRDRTGMYILAGSASNKVSYEASEYGQGLLTYALLTGMKSQGIRETSRANYLDVMKLFQHTRDLVPELAKSINGIQVPMMGFPDGGASIDIGIIDDGVEIPIADKKPVIGRLKFLNIDPEIVDDDQQIEKQLRRKLLAENEKGIKANFIFVNVDDFPNAYSLNGFYTVTERGIEMNAKLIKKGEPSILVPVEPMDDPKRMVQYMLREVKKVLASHGE